MIIVGNCLEKLRELHSDHIQCVVTSPPYWGLRDYDNEDQLGQEDTPEEFVFNLIEIFTEIKRVLKHCENVDAEYKKMDVSINFDTT